jgi:hypothetical protein
MKRAVRIGVFVVGITALVVPFAPRHTTPLASADSHNSTFADGTQPPVPSGPMKPLQGGTRTFDGTQPPVPSGPMKPLLT